MQIECAVICVDIRRSRSTHWKPATVVSGRTTVLHSTVTVELDAEHGTAVTAAKAAIKYAEVGSIL